MDFTQAIREHSDYMRHVIGRTTPEHEIEDVFQDAVLNAWKGWEKFEGRCQVKTWLHTIARNAAYSRYDKMRKGCRIPEDAKRDIDETPLITREENPEDWARGEQLCKAIERAAKHISPALMEPFQCYHFTGVSLDEAAEKFDVKKTTLKSKMNACRKGMARQLRDHLDAITLERNEIEPR